METITRPVAMTRRYRLREAGHPFLLAVAAIVALPASRSAAAVCVALSIIALLAHPFITTGAARAGLATAAIVGLYTARAHGGIALAVAAGCLCGLVALTACNGSVDRLRVEVRAFAFAEVFVYASAVGLLLGLTASNENRRFRISTLGGDRYSFVFAASPSQAAMVAGVGLILAMMTTIRVAAPRRLALGVVSLVLVWGANYRFVVFVVVAVLAVGWLRARHRWVSDSRDRSRLLAVVAIVVAVLPLWWPTGSKLAAEPLASMFSAVPQLGSRSATLDDIEEARTLNRRTEIWDATTSLLGRSTAEEIAGGHGEDGGDDDWQRDVAVVMGESFERLDTVSSHNTMLEQIRRAGILMGGACVVITVGLFFRARRRVTPGCFAGAAVLIAAGGADISVTPFASVTTAMFLTLCLPLRATDPSQRTTATSSFRRTRTR